MTACLSREAVKGSVERSHRKARLSCLCFHNRIVQRDVLLVLLTSCSSEHCSKNPHSCPPLGMLGLPGPLPFTRLPLVRASAMRAVLATLNMAPELYPGHLHLSVHRPHVLSLPSVGLFTCRALCMKRTPPGSHGWISLVAKTSTQMSPDLLAHVLGSFLDTSSRKSPWAS